MKRVAKIRDVKSRGDAVKRRFSIMNHILDAKRNEDDFSEYEDELESLDDEIESFDGRFDQAIEQKVKTQDKTIIKTTQSILDKAKKFGLKEDHLKELKKDLDAALTVAKQYSRRVTSISEKIDDIDDDILEYKQKIVELQQEEEDLPWYETVDHWDRIEDLEADVLSLQRKRTALQARMQRELQEREQAVREEQERLSVVTEAHGDVNGKGKKDEAAGEDAESDVTAEKLLAEAKKLQTNGLKAYKTYVAARIPNDTSVEKELAKRAQDFLSLEKLCKQIAAVYERDELASISLLTFGSILGMPGRALSIAMKLNDGEPRVADWRDSVPGGDSKEMKRTDADMKKFKAYMQSAEKEYAPLLEYIPTTGKAAKLKDLVGAYKASMTRLVTEGHKVQEEYPMLAAALEAVGWVGYHQVNMLKKAIS